jgi:hypothetical protein
MIQFTCRHINVHSFLRNFYPSMDAFAFFFFLDPIGTFEFYLKRHNSEKECTKACGGEYVNTSSNNSTRSSDKRKHSNALVTTTHIKEKRPRTIREYFLSGIPLKPAWADNYGASDLSW